MKKLLAIGEALVDMIPSGMGEIKNMDSFHPETGGAPANVCAAYARLGGTAQLISQVGQDPFGDKILDKLKSVSVKTNSVLRTSQANTSLAFVSLCRDGNRDFTFYRKPGADMLLDPKAVKDSWFRNTYALHFCSVSLGNTPMKRAHDVSIRKARAAGAMISFDPNVRLPLWEHPSELRNVILKYMPKCDILKISDEELPFITGEKNIAKALPKLLKGHTKLVVFTEGSKDAMAITASCKAIVKSRKVKAVDTTGAGDGFIGAFLYCLSRDGVKRLDSLEEDKLREYLEYATAFCAMSVTKHGAISSYPGTEELSMYIAG
jgi:fructokinase